MSWSSLSNCECCISLFARFSVILVGELLMLIMANILAAAHRNDRGVRRLQAGVSQMTSGVDGMYI